MVCRARLVTSSSQLPERAAGLERQGEGSVVQNWNEECAVVPAGGRGRSSRRGARSRVGPKAPRALCREWQSCQTMISNNLRLLRAFTSVN
jgi:hypothetical protein